MAELARPIPTLLAALLLPTPATSDSDATSTSDATQLLSTFTSTQEALEDHKEAVSATSTTPSMISKPATNESTASSKPRASHINPVRRHVRATKLSKVGLSGRTTAVADGSIRGPQCVVM